MCYGDIMREYARQRGLRRCMLPVPVLTPRLSSLWLGLVTPVYARIGRQLIDSIRHATVVQDDTARRVFPVQPMGVHQAIARAYVTRIMPTRRRAGLTPSRPPGGSRPGAGCALVLG